MFWSRSSNMVWNLPPEMLTRFLPLRVIFPCIITWAQKNLMKGDQKHLLPSTMKSLILSIVLRSLEGHQVEPWSIIMVWSWDFCLMECLREGEKRCFRSNIRTYYVVEVCVCGIAVAVSVQDIVNIDDSLLATAELLCHWLNFQKAVGPWVETPDEEWSFGLIINPPDKVFTFMWCLFDLQHTKPYMWNQ